MTPIKLIVQNAKLIVKTVSNYIINVNGIKDLFTGSGNVTSNKIDWTLQHYTNTIALFASTNPILLVGQIGIETDALLTAPKYKIGNGITAWNSLPYASSSTPTLQQVLTNGSSTGGGDIQSPNSFSVLRAVDGTASIQYSDGITFGSVEATPLTTNVVHDLKVLIIAPIIEASQNATTALGIVTKQQLQAYALASGSTAGGDLSGTYPNPAVLNSAVLAKLLTGLNVTGSSLASTDSLLTAFGKLQNQLNGVLGGAIYHGTYNATTNIPTLVDGTGTQGWYYVVATAGLHNFGSGNIDLNIGDWIIYNGTIWQKVDNTDAVSSVNGFIGAVNLTSANITEVTNLYFTTARALATALTGYVSGAGTISATDSILQAIQKLNGNIGAIVSGVSSVNSLTGAVTLTTANVADSTNKRYQTDSQQANNDATSSIQTQLNAKEATSNKDASNGYAGLTLFKINFKNALNTFTSFFTNANTAPRTYTFPDKDITVAGLVDITGTNSGTNTGDNATNTQYSGLAALIGTRFKETFTVTGTTQTTTKAYNFIYSLLRNGIGQIEGTDFTFSGTTITFLTATPLASDVIHIIGKY